MTRIHQWLLRRIASRALVNFELPALMKIINEEHARIFYEDNAATRRAHIEECLP